MKTIIVNEFGNAGVMKLEDVEKPQVRTNQILVKIDAIGVNPVDTYIRSGLYARKPDLPYTPGTDASGIIEETGEGITGLQKGSRVYLTGSLTGVYAEYALCEKDQVHTLPDNVTHKEGACIGVPYTTAYRALFHKAKIKSGETVLIHGASGGVGIAAVQLSTAFGLTVIGTAGTEQGLTLVKLQGAHYTLDHHKAVYLDEILDLTEKNGVDVILEMLADVNLNKDFSVIKTGGRIVVIGNRGSLDFNPRLAMAKDASIHGMTLLNVSKDDKSDIQRALIAGLAKGFLKPIIGKEFSLADAPKAHEEVLAAGAYGKIILIP